MKLLDKLKKKKPKEQSNSPFADYKVEETVPKKRIKHNKASSIYFLDDNHLDGDIFWESINEDDDYLDPIY